MPTAHYKRYTSMRSYHVNTIQLNSTNV